MVMGHGLVVRGDSLYCPLALNLDSYQNCLNDCWHCFFRRLNYVWGEDLRPTDPQEFEKKLYNGLKNTKPKSCVAYSLNKKKTIRFGNKTDPFQPVEKEHRVSKELLEILLKYEWSYVINTMCTELMMDYEDIIVQCKDFVVVQPIISPGAEYDWEVLERSRTTPIEERFKNLKQLKKRGVEVAVNGEPFIPGLHTLKMFEDMIKRLKSNGIKAYNTYNFHTNDYVYKRLIDIGLDVEKIWENNQDVKWKPILRKLCDIADKYDITLGCPDFVNVSNKRVNTTNTCCGIDVKNPTRFNTHHWRNLILKGMSVDEIVKETWDGIGNLDDGIKILTGKSKKMFTMVDAGLVERQEGGLLF